MSKFLLGVSFLSLSFLLFFGLNDPGSPVMWLAASSHGFVILRIVLMGIMLVLLGAGSVILSSSQIRIIIAVLATGLLAYTLRATYLNTFKIVDSLVILMSTISALIAVLDAKPEPEFVLRSTPIDAAKRRAATA